MSLRYTFFWNLSISLCHLCKKFLKILHAGGWYDERGPLPFTAALGDAQKAAARVFLEGDDEHFLLNRHFRLQKRVLNRAWSGWVLQMLMGIVGPVAIWRVISRRVHSSLSRRLAGAWLSVIHFLAFAESGKPLRLQPTPILFYTS